MTKKWMLILTLSLFSSTLWAAEFKTQSEAEKKLATYGVSDVETAIKKSQEARNQKMDEMFDDLTATSKLIGKASPSEDLAYEMVRVTLLTFVHDPTGYAIDTIIEVYKNNTALFDKVAQRFHPYDRDLFLKTIKARVRAEIEGQG